MLDFYRPREEFIETDDSDVITSEQHLSDDFWSDLEDAKRDFRFRLDGFTPVAEIPEVVINKWHREGFDFDNAPAQEIIKKLRMDGYEDFIVSGNKTF